MLKLTRILCLGISGDICSELWTHVQCVRSAHMYTFRVQKLCVPKTLEETMALELLSVISLKCRRRREATHISRSNSCRLLSSGRIEEESVQKYTPHNRTTQRRYTPRDSSHHRRHFGKSIPEFGETHSSVLGCERRPVSASIMSRSCLASFPVCVYKFSSHYLNNIIFYRQ